MSGWENISECTDASVDDPEDPDTSPAAGPDDAVEIDIQTTTPSGPWTLRPWPLDESPAAPNLLRQQFDRRRSAAAAASEHAPSAALSATGDAERVRVLEEQLRKVTEKAARARKAKSKREKKRKVKKKDMAKAAKCQLESSKD